MAGTRLQNAKRALRRAQERVARQRELVARARARGSDEAVTAEELLAVFEQAVERFRERVIFLGAQYGIEERFFTVTATNIGGASLDLAAMDAEAAVMKAMDLVDQGYDHIILCDVVNGDKLQFRPPSSKMN